VTGCLHRDRKIGVEYLVVFRPTPIVKPPRALTCAALPQDLGTRIVVRCQNYARRPGLDQGNGIVFELATCQTSAWM